LYPIKNPPFYAFNEGACTLVTVGGLKVNVLSQVLQSDETPVEGLYALGNTSGSLFSDTYPHHLSGVSLGRCLTFGYLLGRHLAGIED
jgi:predicted oxidoreductase